MEQLTITINNVKSTYLKKIFYKSFNIIFNIQI